MPSTDDQAALETMIRELERHWATLDFKAIRALWDQTMPPLYLAEEAAGPCRSWEELEKYWAATSGIAKRNLVTIRDIRHHTISDDVVSTFYDMHWDIEMPGGKLIGGDNRVCVTWKRTPAGWRIAQYIEAPLAPVLYMQTLYALNVTQGFRTHD